MKKLSVLLLLATALTAQQQSLVANGANATGTFTVPNSAPFNAMGSFRIEMRLHNMNPGLAGYSYVFAVASGGAGYGIGFSSGLLSAQDGATALTVSSSIQAGLTDVVVRYQHDDTNCLADFDVLDYQSGSLLFSRSTSIACGTLQLSGSGYFIRNSSVVTDIAWIKWYSALVPTGSPIPVQSAPADLGDWRFEGNLTNQGTIGSGAVLSIGGATYTSTSVYPPSCNAGYPQSFRAGVQATVDGSASKAGDESGLSYLWQEIPSILPDVRVQRVRWSSHAGAQVRVTGLVFGPLNLQLTVTQGDGQSSTCTVHHGSVATDNNGNTVVNTGNPAFNAALNSLLMLPQPRLGAHPWPFYDQAAMDDAKDKIALYDIGAVRYYTPNAYQDTWDIPLPGTISVTPGSSTITGTGTNFLSTVCKSDGTPSSNNRLMAWYPTGRTVLGQPETGRLILWIGNCLSGGAPSDTTAIIHAGLSCCGFSTWPSSYTPGSALQWSQDTSSQWSNSSAPANFYDSVQAYYQLYYRSGIDTYLIAARNLADRFWTCPYIDRGLAFYNGIGFPPEDRNSSLSGMVLRALDTADGHPDMWAGLHLFWQSLAGYLTVSTPNFRKNDGIDPREYGYSLGDLAKCAMFDQDTSADAPGGLTWPAYCRAAIETTFQPGAPGIWPGALDPDQLGWLQWYEGKSTYDGIQNLPTGGAWNGSTVQLTNGSTAVACTGTNCGWAASDFAMYSPDTGTTCTSGNCTHLGVLFGPTTFPAHSALTDRMVYCVNGCTFLDSNHFTLDTPYQGTTGTHGWVMAVNNGYLGNVPTGMTGYGQDSFMMGILGFNLALANQAMTCTAPGIPQNCDNATAALAATYSQYAANWLLNYAYMPTLYGISYFAGYPTCSNNTAGPVWCVRSPAIASREYMGDSARGWFTAYQFSQSAALRTAIDNWYGATWGKPGTNPIVASPDGTYDSSFDSTGCTVNAMYPIFTNCPSQNAYWLDSGPVYTANKLFGQMFGISDQASWPAVRAGGILPSELAQMYVSGRINDVPGATRMQVTMTEPTGIAGTPVVCSSSPCAVTVDRQLGNPTIQVSYLDASGKVVSQGQPFTAGVN